MCSVVATVSYVSTPWKVNVATHSWSVQVPTSKLIFPVPKPLGGVNESRLTQRVNRRKSSHLFSSTGHCVKIHRWAAATKNDKINKYYFTQNSI